MIKLRNFAFAYTGIAVLFILVYGGIMKIIESIIL